MKGRLFRPVSIDAALMYGFLHASKHQAGEARTLVFRFVSVWVRTGNEWKLTFLQNAKPVVPAA
jgi:ketosteroid isomerase-like protein